MHPKNLETTPNFCIKKEGVRLEIVLGGIALVPPILLWKAGERH